MTVSSTTHSQSCPKCGSSMRYNVKINSSGEKVMFLLCRTCKFPIELGNLAKE